MIGSGTKPVKRFLTFLTALLLSSSFECVAARKPNIRFIAIDDVPAAKLEKPAHPGAERMSGAAFFRVALSKIQSS